MRKKSFYLKIRFLMYCWKEGSCILGWLLQATAVKGYHAFLLLVACQKRKPWIDSSFLSVHISSGKIHFRRNSCYRRLLKWVVTMNLGLVIINQLLWLTPVKMVTMCTEHSRSINMQATCKGDSLLWIVWIISCNCYYTYWT